MDSYGCPLCCQQKFNSIVALKEHLVYFTFRPLLCVLCRMTIGGIFELIQHLETHLISEKNSTADVLRNVRYMDDENCLPNEIVRYDACNTNETVDDNLNIDHIYDQKMLHSHSESPNKPIFNASFSKAEDLDSKSNAIETEIVISEKSICSAEYRENEKEQGHGCNSISTTISELCEESNSENLSICSLSENESLNEQEERTVNYSEADAVRAYVCHECGVKIVGKDFYFSHLQEHSIKSLNLETFNNEPLPVPDEQLNVADEQLNVDVRLKEVSILNKENKIFQMDDNPHEDTNNFHNSSNIEEDSNPNPDETQLIILESSGNDENSQSTEMISANKDNVSFRPSKEHSSELSTVMNNSKTCSSSMQHYIHKKFDHDQERKFEGLSANSDVQCYIQNFQSLLVNKLNEAFENNELKMISDSNTELEAGEENTANDSPQVDVTMSNNDKYHCRYCTKPFVWKQTRDTHELNRKCSTVNVCKHCNKEFGKYNTLSRHEQEAHANEVFFCKVCGRHFKSLRYLSNHKGVHDKKRYTCSKCPSSFHTASGLRSHIHEAHSLPQKGKEMVCEHCGEKFKRKYGLQRHIERKHSSVKLTCRYCNKEFTCKEDLSSHMIIHLHSESLSCNICDMIFTSQSSLKRHREKHKNITKSFQCKTCFTLFTRKDSLVCHIQSQHRTNLRYECKCGKAFNKASHLKYHEVKHSKEPPQFQCEVCEKTFKYKISFKKHNCKEKKS